MDSASKPTEVAKMLEAVNCETSGIGPTTVDKRYHSKHPVLQFRELEYNTDLKRPPSNWLHEQAFIHLSRTVHRHSDFSSFLMAHQFPDCIGEVDIVSDSENIKKLLKIPFNQRAQVSMMIHRIGNTLLLDEFDLYKYLFRKSESEWKWLREFFYEHILQMHNLPTQEDKLPSALVRPNKSRDLALSRNLLSKFLYHSVKEEETVTAENNENLTLTSSPVSVQKSHGVEVMPEPTREQQLPHPTCQSFARNVVWNFQDLHLLIGTDLPIFGGGTHPCVSLRLLEKDKPISVLTGIDYWLDNLMCNVPEVIMCYHLDGIVQNYQLMKTEELPQLTGSPFSASLIRNVAQNILSFLNSNTTKEGHTYWLFKAKDDDIVKLYDLTSLCMEGGSATPSDSATGTESGIQTADPDNPFTVPVAMLFYRVAKGLKSSDEAGGKQATIQALLKNCISLLDPEKYPKIVTSAHYMLSDIYLPQDMSTDTTNLTDIVDEESEFASTNASDDDDNCNDTLVLSETEDEDVTTSPCHRMPLESRVSVSSLTEGHEDGFKRKSRLHSYKPPPVTGSLEDRCQLALSHLEAALSSLRLPAASPAESRLSPELQEPHMACSSEPIPMPYAPLQSHTGCDLVLSSGDLCQKEAELRVCVTADSVFSVATWQDKLHVLLLRKVSLVYLVLGRVAFSMQRYGKALRCLKSSYHAWNGMLCQLGSSQTQVPPPGQALMLSGDTYYLLSKNWLQSVQHIEDFNVGAQVHANILGILEDIWPAQDSVWSIKFPCDIEEALTLSLNSFQQSLSTAEGLCADLLCSRLGNVCNELAVLYMNQAAKLCKSSSMGLAGGLELWRKSGELLNRGVEVFTKVNDVANVALLHSNCGKLFRLCAFYGVPPQGDSPQLGQQERHYYQQAIKSYERALAVLKSRKKWPEIWNVIVWEFSTTLFTMGSLLQDASTPKSVEEVRPEMIDLFSRALNYCDLKSPGTRLPLYQYRAAVIHMRLGQLYHSSARIGRDRKNMRHLAELHYNKSASLFLVLKHTTDALKVHLQQVELIEDQLPSVKGTQMTLKLHMNILKLLLGCCDTLKSLQQILHKNDQCQSPAKKVVPECSDKENRENLGVVNDSTKKQIDHEEKLSEEYEEKLNAEQEDESEQVKHLLMDFQKKLQTILMASIKICNSSKGNKKSLNEDVEMLKSMYSTSLNSKNLPLVDHLIVTVTQLSIFIGRLSFY